VSNLLEMLSNLPNIIGMFHCENSKMHREGKRRVRELGRHGLEAWVDASPNVAEAMQIEQ